MNSTNGSSRPTATSMGSVAAAVLLLAGCSSTSSGSGEYNSASAAKGRSVEIVNSPKRPNGLTVIFGKRYFCIGSRDRLQQNRLDVAILTSRSGDVVAAGRSVGYECSLA